ncbi:Dol-P-Man:Man(7)GlcNAc(2)-PP-Dol alpha-1,6-mannosyltransferase [Lachnellula occidentalis]|uniref:Mannosyltransferase n=1 Tax=Lachnellula occidentalis TaxID=215460 RepID=A0A8H8S160_9HELO|nr:Dol-P-Man:Man(7)GlcNAc(2)-PP-Dol alpha-1,6-mannosyltransferase [Lachnellula occidentalis]
MKAIDAVLILVLPTLILLHLAIAPYTKVEESFNLQATHDISTYGFRVTPDTYDHISFPGAVPRTFFGALVLSALSSPVFSVIGRQHAQLVARAVLGLFNTYSLLRFKNGLDGEFGRGVGRWFIWLMAGQFHVLFYASRTLPNMYAFGLTTLAFNALLPLIGSRKIHGESTGVKKAIFLFVFAGVVFRSEIALLLATQLLVLLVQKKISLKTVIPAGVISALVALAISVPIDSYFWQKPLWPELWGFYYNAIQGKSADWGTSPFSYYFTSLLPKLLLNPLILVLLPLAYFIPATQHPTMNLALPSLLYIAIYSLQPHKEARFIIYPHSRRRTPSILHLDATLKKLALHPRLCRASSIHSRKFRSINMHAPNILTQLPRRRRAYLCALDPAPNPQQPIQHHYPHGRPLLHDRRNPVSAIALSLYPKGKAHTYQLRQNGKFGHASGSWVLGAGRLCVDGGTWEGYWEVGGAGYGVCVYWDRDFEAWGWSSFSENMERVYAANNITVEHNGKSEAPGSEEVKDAVDGEEVKNAVRGGEEERRSMEDLRARLLFEEMSKFGTFNLLRDGVRTVTGGWWVGPRMEPRIRVLKRVEDDIP